MYITYQFLVSRGLYLRFEMRYVGTIWHGCSYLRHQPILLILSCLSDFMTLSERLNIYSEGSISQLWNTVGRYNLVYMFIRHSNTQIVNNVMLE